MYHTRTYFRYQNAEHDAFMPRASTTGRRHRTLVKPCAAPNSFIGGDGPPLAPSHRHRVHVRSTAGHRYRSRRARAGSPSGCPAASPAPRLGPLPAAARCPRPSPPPGSPPPSRLPPPHPSHTARPASSRSPRSPPASRPADRSPGTPQPPRSVTSTRTGRPHTLVTTHLPRPTVTAPPGRPEPLGRTLMPESPLTSNTAASPHGRPGRAPDLRTPGQAASALHARPPYGPGHHRHQRPARPGAGRGCTPGSAAAVEPRTGRPDSPSVAVRGKPTVHADRPSGRTPSAICPWTPRHSGPQRYKVTHDGTEKKRPG